MVLNDLGHKIAGALRRLNEVVVVDDELIDGCLKEICNALLSADVGVAQVVRVKKNILKDLDAENAPSGMNAKKMLERAVFKELTNLLNGGGGRRGE